MPDLRTVPEDLREIRRDANLLCTLTPTTQLLMQPDYVMWLHFEPIDEVRTNGRVATFVPRSAPVSEEMQVGFALRGIPGRPFGRFEGALNRFNLAAEEMITNWRRIAPFSQRFQRGLVAAREACPTRDLQFSRRPL